MIYLTGDTHGDIGRFQYIQNTGEPKLTKEDYLMIAGDFGFLFFFKTHPFYRHQEADLNKLAELPYTILWVDGNHENFEMLKSYPVEMWHGGKVQFIRHNVIHLMRGQVYDIDGTRVFTMGGAFSRDRGWRIEGLSFWREEVPHEKDFREAINNLKRVNMEVDLIVTHNAPSEIIRRMGASPDEHEREFTGFLEWIMYEVKFQKWFFGHWHRDEVISAPKHMECVYSEVIPFRENKAKRSR